MLWRIGMVLLLVSVIVSYVVYPNNLTLTPPLLITLLILSYYPPGNHKEIP